MPTMTTDFLKSRLDKFETYLKHSPEGQQLEAKLKADSQRERQAHVDSLAEIQKQVNAERPKLIAAHENAKKKMIAAQAAFEQASREYGQAQGMLIGNVGSEEVNRGRIQRLLEETAPVEIDEFVEKLQNELNRLRKETPTTETSYSLNVLQYGQRVVKSNMDQLGGRMVATVEAIRATRELKWTALEGPALNKRLAEIWNSLPDTSL